MSEQKLIEQLEKLIDIGIALSSEQDVDILLEKILLCAKSITHADGGTLYRADREQMRIAIIHSTSLNIHLGGSSRKVVDLPAVPLYLDNGGLNLDHVVCYAYHNKATVKIDDVYAADDQFDFSGPLEFDRRNNYLTKSLLTLPLKNHNAKVIGVLQLINPIDTDSGALVCFDDVSEKITSAMASQAAIVLTQQQLIANLEKLFQSLVKLVATAIDQKSPYTGAHSRRVPIITMMLAEAVHEIDHGPFKDFALSAADRYELEIAAWLHDCGKIITPEAVMDKSTKLQTVFDRISLVETRFEVLKRDREIELLKAKIATLEQGLAWDGHLQQTYQQAIDEIDNNLAFVKRVNIGAESMSSEDIDRVRELSSQKCQIGGKTQLLLSADEAYNLSIPYGTLTKEEREIINNHIVATISMLGAIEFPEHLQHVPEFAGGHHERMDGKGYPRGLRREELSVQARIMGIADIFEALMDSCRPYKKGKKLSEALAILQKMKDNGHIDPDLFEVFLEKKIYRKYAEQFVEADQIDID